MTGTSPIGVRPVGVLAAAASYALNAEAGAFVLSGQAANGAVSIRMDAGAGSYALSGQSDGTDAVVSSPIGVRQIGVGTRRVLADTPILVVSRALIAETGAFTLSGGAVTDIAQPDVPSGTGGRSFYLPPEPIKRKRKPDVPQQPVRTLETSHEVAAPYEAIAQAIARELELNAALSQIDAEIAARIHMEMQDEDDAVALLLMAA